MFEANSICPACRKRDMDVWGDHAIHCAHGVGGKHKHNVVRDILLDCCTRVGISGKKEAQVGLFDVAGKNARPADVLLFDWTKGKDCCIDIVGVSPFAGTTTISQAPGDILIAAEKRKRVKYSELCKQAGLGFVPFAFSTMGELGSEALSLLDRVKAYAKNTGGAAGRVASFIMSRIGFSIQRGVGAQLVARLPSNYL